MIDSVIVSITPLTLTDFTMLRETYLVSYISAFIAIIRPIVEAIITSSITFFRLAGKLPPNKHTQSI